MAGGWAEGGHVENNQHRQSLPCYSGLSFMLCSSQGRFPGLIRHPIFQLSKRTLDHHVLSFHFPGAIAFPPCLLSVSPPSLVEPWLKQSPNFSSVSWSSSTDKMQPIHMQRGWSYALLTRSVQRGWVLSRPLGHLVFLQSLEMTKELVQPWIYYPFLLPETPSVPLTGELSIPGRIRTWALS